MRSLLRSRLTYANVMSSIAVFAALGGGAYAATGALTPSSSTIKGCVGKRNGTLHVTHGRKCPKGSSALLFNQKGPQGAAGAAGAAGTAGPAGPQGPPGATGITRWGNVVIPEGGADKVVASVGPFTLTAKCSGTGEGSYELTTTATGDWVYGEDSSLEELNPGGESEVADDEDYDESFYAYSPSTGVTINGLPFQFEKGHGNTNACEFQGSVTQTS